MISSTRLLIEGQEVDLGEAVVALTKQANDITKPESIQADYSNTITLPDTQKNRVTLGYADEVGSETDVPYRVLDAQLYKDGVEVVPYGKAELMNGSFELDIYSGNRNFFDVLGDKSIRELDLSAFNHTWNYADIVANAGNNTWQQGFVYDLYDRGKALNLGAVDAFDLYPSVFGRAIWEQIFKDAGFTYTGFTHPMFDRFLVPLAELYEYSDEYRKAREFRVTSNDPDVHRQTLATEKIKFNYVRDGFGVDTNGGYQLNNWQYVVDAPRMMTFDTGIKVRINSTTGFVEAALTIRVNGVIIAEAKFNNRGTVDPLDPNGNATRFLTISSSPRLVNAGDVVEVFVKLDQDGEALVSDPDMWIYHTATGSETPYFSGKVLGEFPKGGAVELAKWLPDISQKDFVKAMHSLFGMSFQTELYQDSIKIGQFADVVNNIPQAIDMSDRVHAPEKVRPSFKFGDFAQKNKILWKEDDSVTDGFNDGFILVNDTTLPAEKDLIKLPFAATEASRTAGVLSIPMWKAKANTNPVEYEKQKVQPRLVVQSPDTVAFNLFKGVPSGEIVAGVGYKVYGYSKVHYDNNTYETNTTFLGVSGVTGFTAEGAGFVGEIGFETSLTGPVAYFVDPLKPYDLSIQDYIIPTFYTTLLAILDKTKVLPVQMALPAEFIQNWNQSVPVWIEYWGQYFYINKIEEYIDEASLTSVELIRL